MSTPHIKANEGDFAKTVLMPGDPLRAKYIAENYLTDAVLVNNVRGIQGYTGYYNGKRVSVMASGMGMPSMGIYSYELFAFFGVENIIRVGSAGSLQDDIKLLDIVIGESASTDSNYPKIMGVDENYTPTATESLVKKAVLECQKQNAPYKVGNVLSSDVFYSGLDNLKNWSKKGVLAVEMESAALYTNAAKLGKNALTILTISDCPFTGEETSPDQRERNFDQMIKIALEIA